MFRIIYADNDGTTITNLSRSMAIEYAKACLLACVDFTVQQSGDLFNSWRWTDVTSEIATAARKAMQ